MDDQPALVDLNTAGLDELLSLPGVGPAMAERIRTARPFTSLEDVRRVSGVGPALLERWQLLVTVSPVASAAPPEGEAGAMSEPSPEEVIVSEAFPEGEVSGPPAPIEAAPPPEAQVASEAEAPPTEASVSTEAEAHPPVEAQASTQATSPQPGPRFASRWEAFGFAACALLLATLFASALSLGMLVLINGGLSYARPSQIADLSRSLQAVNADTEVLQQDLEALRSRIDNLEGLSGRVGEVEEALDAAQAQVDSLDRRLDGLDQAVADMQAQANRFQGFLDGLRSLMDNLFKP